MRAIHLDTCARLAKDGGSLRESTYNAGCSVARREKTRQDKQVYRTPWSCGRQGGGEEEAGACSIYTYTSWHARLYANARIINGPVRERGAHFRGARRCFTRGRLVNAAAAADDGIYKRR